jgi:hypothetical protein
MRGEALTGRLELRCTPGLLGLVRVDEGVALGSRVL